MKMSDYQAETLLALADNPAVWVRNRYRTHEGTGKPIASNTAASLIWHGWASVQREYKGDACIIRLVITATGLEAIEPYL